MTLLVTFKTTARLYDSECQRLVVLTWIGRHATFKHRRLNHCSYNSHFAPLPQRFGNDCVVEIIQQLYPLISNNFEQLISHKMTQSLQLQQLYPSILAIFVYLWDCFMGAGTGRAGWASAHPGKNLGGHGPPWKF